MTGPNVVTRSRARQLAQKGSRVKRATHSAARGTSTQNVPQRPNVTTRLQALRNKKLYHQFPHFPPEIRRRIWQMAAPGYGTCPVVHRIDCRSDVVRISGRASILRPAKRRYWDLEFTERASTNRALLLACRESHQEVRFLFPDKLSFPSGKLRLHLEEDVLKQITWEANVHLDQPRLEVCFVDMCDSLGEIMRSLHSLEARTWISLKILSSSPLLIVRC